MTDPATIITSFISMITSIPLPFIIIALVVMMFWVARSIDKRLLRVRPGQIGVIWSRATGTIVAWHHEPGRHKIGKLPEDLRALRLTVNKPVLVYSGTIEARTLKNERIWLIVSLVLTITSPESYVTMVVQRELEAWCQRELPGPIIAVVCSYTVQQIRDTPEEITSRIAAEVAPRLSPSLGLVVSQASFLKVWTARAAVPSRATLARLQARELTRPDPLGEPKFGAFPPRMKREHLEHHGRITVGRIISITYRSSSTSSSGSSTSSRYETRIEFESDGITYTVEETTSSRPNVFGDERVTVAVPEGGLVTIRYCPYYPTRCFQTNVR